MKYKIINKEGRVIEENLTRAEAETIRDNFLYEGIECRMERQ